jgi:hypothetical protein
MMVSNNNNISNAYEGVRNMDDFANMLLAKHQAMNDQKPSLFQKVRIFAPQPQKSRESSPVKPISVSASPEPSIKIFNADLTAEVDPWCPEVDMLPVFYDPQSAN